MDVLHAVCYVSKYTDKCGTRLQVRTNYMLVVRSVEQPQQPHYLLSTVVDQKSKGYRK